MAEPTPSDGDEYTRLHITPLTPSLLPTILSQSLLPIARNISYHSIQTFPERAYGFLELPKEEASKLKKKLNGAILKGTKIRIESARPQNIPVPEEPEPEKPKKERGKKRKRDETIPAVEIGERNVKRGWTVPVSKVGKKDDKKEKKTKSKYTSGKECLFKTVVPPNKVDLTEKRKKKKKGKGPEEVVVHEFEKTVKHASFLRAPKVEGKAKTASEYVEGKGWVDEDGNLVEEVVIKRKSDKAANPIEKDVTPESSSEEDSSSEDDGSSEGDSSSEEDESSEGDSLSEDGASKPQELSKPVDEDSNSSDSSDSDSESDAEPSGQEPQKTPQSILKNSGNASSRPVSSSGLTLTIPEPTAFAAPSEPKVVHPLEALYKRPAATPDSQRQATGSNPSEPSFSFFGNDEDVEPEESEAQNQVLFTPYTQKEFEFRVQRSAAPTPDTAHVNKKFVWPTDQTADDEEEDSSPVSKIKGKGVATEHKDGEGDAKGTEAESEFQKWFYEHRGEANRAWKKRRKAVAKEKRHRENKKRGGRAA
ncbi:hypothetical protein M430DRAFT_67641 [Amorphotheca resinae ATCC 22711]|uniref:RRM domain-containing protein n=1 Tax=Amorphotheca resinae ATCC 22711 TaxID=857342 RepID=A0A2T3AY66_AMORE|nr:hypothetical protein M430DRAFT_67641 [Amorphotheca resinae ATCC 22711]PSS15016.1 hypothetical protein M430DRAFT_67641 [Amorphotheca resinae ATCC 22711]